MMMLTYNSIEIVGHNNLCSILLIYTIIIWHSKVYKVPAGLSTSEKFHFIFWIFLSKCGF